MVSYLANQHITLKKKTSYPPKKNLRDKKESKRNSLSRSEEIKQQGKE
jgi:hypothetical protein